MDKKKLWLHLSILVGVILVYVFILVSGARAKSSDAFLSPAKTGALKTTLFIFAIIYFVYLIFIFSSKIELFFKRKSKKKHSKKHK